MLVAGLALALAIVLFPGAFLRGEIFFERDLNFDWYLRIEAIARAAREAALPLWDPGIGFGQPLLADPGTQVLYPATWLGLPAARVGYTAFVARCTCCSRPSAAPGSRAPSARARSARRAAALLWALSRADAVRWSTSATTSPAPPGCRGCCWPPTGPRGRPGAARLCAGGGARRPDPRGVGRRVRHDLGARRVGGPLGGAFAGAAPPAAVPASGARACAAAAALSVGLTAIVWWPALDVLSRSPRRDLPEEIRTAWSIPPAGLLRLVVPARPRPRAARRRPLAGPVRRIPAAVPVLAVPRRGGAGDGGRGLRVDEGAAARRAAPRRGRRGPGGRHGPARPVYPLLVALVPPLRIFRYPSKLTIVAALLVALAAGLGLAALRRGRIGPRRSILLSALLLLAALVSALVSRRYGRRVDPGGASRGDGRRRAGARGLGSRSPRPRRRRHRRAGGRGPPRRARAAESDVQPALFLDPPPLVASVDGERGEGCTSTTTTACRGPPRRLLGRTNPYSYVTPPPGWDRRAFITVAFRLYLVPPFAGLYGHEGSYDFDLRGLYPVYLNDLTFFLRRTEGLPAHSKLLRMGAVGTVVSLHDGGFGDPVATLASLFPEPIRVWRVPSAVAARLGRRLRTASRRSSCLRRTPRPRLRPGGRGDPRRARTCGHGVRAGGHEPLADAEPRPGATGGRGGAAGLPRPGRCLRPGLAGPDRRP